MEKRETRWYKREQQHMLAAAYAAYPEQFVKIDRSGGFTIDDRHLARPEGRPPFRLVRSDP